VNVIGEVGVINVDDYDPRLLPSLQADVRCWKTVCEASSGISSKSTLVEALDERLLPIIATEWEKRHSVEKRIPDSISIWSRSHYNQADF